MNRWLALAVALSKAAHEGQYRASLARNMRSFLDETAYYSDLAEPRVECFPADVPDAVDLGPGLLVTTSAGLFHLTGKQWRRLLKTPGYGVALDGLGNLFVVCSPNFDSHIVKARIAGEGPGLALTELRQLFSFATRYHGERLHQIAWDPHRQALLCANTRRNSILVLDPVTGLMQDEIFLLADRFGHPIWMDVNHINGVAPHSSAILFSAHTLGKGGGLGFVTPDRVCVFAYPGRGLHDVLIHDGAIMFTDSFRNARISEDPQLNGAIVHGRKELHVDEIGSVVRSTVLRGIVNRRDAIVVGCSAFAKREQRFQERGGGVLIVDGVSNAAFVSGPFSQVYDVLSVDVGHTDRGSDGHTIEDLYSMFARDVGPCVYDASPATDRHIPKLR